MSASLPLLFIVGPTCSGKTELAVRLRESSQSATPAPLLNCDSVQVYASVEIGAAKPTPEQLARGPHELLSFVPDGVEYRAGDYRRDALAAIERAHLAGAKCAVVVGGSGFYAQALERGMPPYPPSNLAARAVLEARAAERGLLALWEELRARDPERAAKIAPADAYRIVRALEILEAQPRTLTEIDRQFERDSRPLFVARKIGLVRDRGRLREAIEARARIMLKSGLIEETEALRARGLAAWAPLRSVGYKEAQAVLDGLLAPSEILEAIVTSSMQLAKRQMTWFRRDTQVEWHDADSAFESAVTSARAHLSELEIQWTPKD